MTAASHNPFQCGRPVTEPAGFFGRERELRRLRGYLEGSQWVSIVGPRRIGKTSLLLQLNHPQAADRLGLASSEYHFVYVDAQGLGNLSASEWFRYLFQSIAQALDAPAADAPATGLEFRENLAVLLSGGQNLVLMIDEFEALAADEKLDAGFFSLLRSLSTAYPISLVTASRTPISELTQQHKERFVSPFFNTFNLLRLGPLDVDAATALLRQPEAGFADDIVLHLLEWAGLQPCFLQLAGYYAYEQQQEGPLTEISLQAVRGELEAAAWPHLQYVWGHLSEEARYTLATLPMSVSGEPSVRELREACLVRDHAYDSLLVEHFVRRQEVADVLQRGPLMVDLRRQQATWHGRAVSTTPLSLDVLTYLMRRADTPVSWLQLETAVWGKHESLPEYYEGNQERVDAVVKRLRAALQGVGAGNLIDYRGGVYTLHELQLQ